MKKKLIIIGGGGHARSILGLLIKNKLTSRIIGYSDNKKSNLPIKYLGNDNIILKNFKKKDVEIVIGVGIHLSIREKIIRKFKKYNFFTLVDKDSKIISNLPLGKGTIIYPNANVSSNVKIKNYCVIHNSTTIDHDVQIQSNSYIDPGAVVCGNAKIGKNVLIGANATLIQDTILADRCKLGAGSVLIKSCKTKNKTLIGSPAKIYKKK